MFEERLPKPEIIQDLPKKAKGRKWLLTFKNFTLNSMTLGLFY